MGGLKNLLYNEIYPALDRAEVLRDHFPQEPQGGRIALYCPSCGGVANIPQGGLYILCEEKRDGEYTCPPLSLWEYERDYKGMDNITILHYFYSLATKTISRDRFTPAEADGAAALSDLRELALEYFAQALYIHPAGLDYLKGRGYTEEEIGAMGVGYYASLTELKKALPPWAAEGDLLYRLGLDMGYGRIAIPYRDPEGRLKGFVFRALAEEPPEVSKYLVSRGTQKDTLFNLDRWRGGPVVIVEGYLDALISAARGLPGLVATGTSNLLERQLDNALEAGVTEYILAFDADPAGERGREKAIQDIYGRAQEKGVTVRVKYINDYNGAKDPEEMIRAEGIEALRGKLEAAQDGAAWILEQKGIKPYRLGDLIKDLTEARPGLKTGYAQLDQWITISPEAVTVIAGRPGHLKTSFLMNLCLNMALDPEYKNRSFIFFSYEESRRQIGVKLVKILGGAEMNPDNLMGYIQHREGREGSPIKEVEDGLAGFDELTRAGRLWIIDTPFTAEDLKTALEMIAGAYDIGAVFIDYLQKVRARGSWATRQVELQRASAIILETAIKLSIPIIVGAQFGRDQKGDKAAVRLDNLREAGDIEQDANLVLGLYYPPADKEADKEGNPGDGRELQIYLLKNRNAETREGPFCLSFNGPTRKIADIKEPKY